MRSEVQILPDPPLAVGAPSRASRPGAIAQLGERLLCKQEVVGSIPTGSTTHQSDDAPASRSAMITVLGAGDSDDREARGVSPAPRLFNNLES